MIKTRTNPRDIARRLLNLAAEFDTIQISERDYVFSEKDEQGILEEYGFAKRVRRRAEDLIHDLEVSLIAADLFPFETFPDQLDGSRWTFGSALSIIGDRQSIYGGFLDPVKNIPILDRVPDRAVNYLITVEDGNDYLKRETHPGVGWHYHYLDWKKRRSDVILCWDNRWKAPVPQSHPPARRGLFVEKHAERDKPFIARPEAWSEKKRWSMYVACDADLRTRTIKEYRCAANNSNPVYPPGAVVTPRPLQPSSTKQKTPKPKPRNGR